MVLEKFNLIKKCLTPASSSDDDDYIKLPHVSAKLLTLKISVDKHNYLKLSIIDDKHHKTKGNLGALNKVSSVQYVGCCNEMVLLKSDKYFRKYHALNPLSAEGRITTISNHVTSYGDACGFFFHPLAKEYRILSCCRVSLGKNGNECYIYIYPFGAKTWRRAVNPRFNCDQTLDPKDVSIANGCLHWYNGGLEIVVFDMISEEFCVRRSPIESQSKRRKLLVNEDRLFLSNVVSNGRAIDIWVLEDYKKWSWIKKYVVDTDWDMLKYPMQGDRVGCELVLSYVNVISIHKDNLMLFWQHRGLFSYHLVRNTIKKIPQKEESSEAYDKYGVSWSYRDFQ